MLRFFKMTLALLILMSVQTAPVSSGGLFGNVVEGLCGGCGVGKELDRKHAELGNPLDIPGRVIRESTVETMGPLVARAISLSRDNARRAGTQPIPNHIYQRLLRFYPSQLLRGVRYRVGQGHELSVQANSFRFGDAGAVALIDTIVFRSSRDAQINDQLWAHEIKHIDQYRRWGLTDFAKRYVRDYSAVERDADLAEQQYARLPAPHTNRPSRNARPHQTTPRQFGVASFCYTNFGNCAMAVAIPPGSRCFCPTYRGQVWGIAR